MIGLLEDIKGLVRRNEGLSDNLSSTEVAHYAAEVLHRLRRGSAIEMLELYVRQLRPPGSCQFQVHRLRSSWPDAPLPCFTRIAQGRIEARSHTVWR
jgi:hypothetical protein